VLVFGGVVRAILVSLLIGALFFQTGTSQSEVWPFPAFLTMYRCLRMCMRVCVCVCVRARASFLCCGGSLILSAVLCLCVHAI